MLFTDWTCRKVHHGRRASVSLSLRLVKSPRRSEMKEESFCLVLVQSGVKLLLILTISGPTERWYIATRAHSEQQDMLEWGMQPGSIASPAQLRFTDASSPPVRKDGDCRIRTEVQPIPRLQPYRDNSATPERGNCLKETMQSRSATALYRKVRTAKTDCITAERGSL